jgi:hypothetical protein
MRSPVERFQDRRREAEIAFPKQPLDLAVIQWAVTDGIKHYETILDFLSESSRVSRKSSVEAAIAFAIPSENVNYSHSVGTGRTPSLADARRKSLWGERTKRTVDSIT